MLSSFEEETHCQRLINRVKERLTDRSSLFYTFSDRVEETKKREREVDSSVQTEMVPNTFFRQSSWFIAATPVFLARENWGGIGSVAGRRLVSRRHERQPPAV